MKIHLVLLLIGVATSPVFPCTLMMPNTPCTKFVNGLLEPILIASECANYPDDCMMQGTECLACNKSNAKDDTFNDDDTRSASVRLIDEAINDGKRSLSGIPFPPNFPGSCMPPVPFPGNCKPTRNEPYVLEPPVDIPYCFRIPCDPSDNSLYDKSHRDCGMQPGCYFDKPLSEYREAFGPSVLPGVPVCHLAIRNKKFRDKAQAVVAKYGAWNPYFTNCLLKTFDDEIREGPAGCDLIPIVEVFHVIPKMAGWGTITSYECSLIDACFLPGRGCFYPVDISNVRVKSGQRYTPVKKATKYGRPKCQAFDNSSPINTLRSYHRCLSAGCTVCESITVFYHSHLFSIGEQFTVDSHWDYWRDIGRGIVGPHNIQESFGQYVARSSSSSGTSLPPTTAPQTSVNPFDLPFGRRRRSIHSNCGITFKPYGGRPCPPPKPIKPNYGHCPYKPFFVPRFPVLTGSFEGCCEINLCYLPKEEISKMHYSGPSHYYTEWSVWSKCSVTCGVGFKARYRKCVSLDRSLCTERLEEKMPCKDADCCTWSRWGGWSPCPVTCFPGGVQSRTRRPSGPQCNGPHEQVRTCNYQTCSGFCSPPGTYGPWSSYVCVFQPHTRTCKYTRQRFCRDNFGNLSNCCDGVAYEENIEVCNGC